MQPTFRFIVAMVFIFTSALGAPTSDGVENACVRVQGSSSELNKISRILSVQTRVGIANLTGFFREIPWVENQDKCDPGSLRKNATTCIVKMSAVLRKYHSEVKMVGKLQVCSNFTKQIKQAMHDFYTDMRECVTATRKLHLPGFSASAEHQWDEARMWEAAPLCHYIMERLFSFSIVTARVFALGDPAKHSHGSAAQCL